MRKFIVDESFWEIFPNAKIGISVFHGINNEERNSDKYVHMLEIAQKEAKKYFIEEEWSKNEVIKVWREAFQKFKTKKGVRSSIEALLKRVNNGNTIGNINPLVDIYNSISLKYAMPCGGEDIDTFLGDVKLTKALGNEPFITLGSEENESPLEGEIIYKDEFGAICRCWNWRESVRTMLTPSTSNAFLCIELVDLSREVEFINALNELSHVTKENLGGEYVIHILDINNKYIEF
jgi:DNA/RNA-binding domain of Phe-tRNA-synthetase-like protein